MNIDIKLVARALNKAGEEPLTPEEIETKEGTRWRIIKDCYLATILEELAQVSWTSQKRRARLSLSEEENLTSYSYMYELPINCAKPVGLNSEQEYLVENGFLYTNDADPILIYVTNYYTGKFKYEVADPQPTEETFPEQTYYFLGDDGEYYQEVEYDERYTYYIRVHDDYDFYDDPKLDPSLEECIATRLASSIVLKLTGDTNKYQLLYGEAIVMENRANKASEAHGHNKGKGNKPWGELLGLPTYEED